MLYEQLNKVEFLLNLALDSLVVLISNEGNTPYLEWEFYVLLTTASILLYILCFFLYNLFQL